MKILTTLLITLPLICTPLAAAAEKDGGKGPSERAWERANDNASFKRGEGGYKHEYHDRWRKQADDPDVDRRERDRDRDREDAHRDRDYHDSKEQDRGSRDPNRARDRDDNSSREDTGDDYNDNPAGRMIRENRER